MDFKFNIDTSSMEKELKEDLTSKMRNACKDQTHSFFSINRTAVKDDKGNFKIIKESGDGLKTIDDMIANKFLDPKFQESMQRFFDHNWEEIFKECMTRALQHKANGIAFNKMHTLSIK